VTVTAREPSVRASTRWRVALAALLAAAAVAALVPVVLIPLAAGAVLAAAWARPGLVLALSLNGFFAYLAVFEVAGVETRTRTTAGYYAFLAAVLGWIAWRRRALVLERARTGVRLARAWLVAAAVLGGWFALNVLVVSDGRLAHRMLALFCAATVPAVLVVLGSDESLLRQAAYGMIGLGAALAVIAFATLAVDPPAESGRFSPLAELDTISAAIVACVAAVTVLALPGPLSPARLGLFAVLAAAAYLPGARGPVLSLVLAALVVALVRGRRLLLPVGAALACGLVLGSVVGTRVDASDKFGHLVTDTVDAPESEAGRISSLNIRRQLLGKAIREVPDSPIVGNGVGSLVDDTPEAARMGIAGERVYPHNDLVEAIHALGVIGFVPFLVFAVLPAVALLRLWRLRARAMPYLLPLGLFAFALVESNWSGEIGADSLLWASAALAVVLYHDAVKGGRAQA
jgi:O-antigen ligase